MLRCASECLSLSEPHIVEPIKPRMRSNMNKLTPIIGEEECVALVITLMVTLI